MSQQTHTIAEMIDQLRTGEIAPGSKEGTEAIRQIAITSPSDLATKLYHLPNNALEMGMRAAGMSESDIEELLLNGEDIQVPDDPFADAVELTPDDAMQEGMMNPAEFDPTAVLRNGPRPR